MFLLLLLVATVRPLVMIEDNFRLWFYSLNGNYTIYVKFGENETRYSYPVEVDVQLKYDGNFTLNNQLVNIVYQNGTVTPPLIIQTMFKARAINSMEQVQVCYNFTTERITLKAVVGILTLAFVASHGGKIRTTIKTLGEDLLQSKLARRLSRSGSSVAGSQTTYTHVEKEGCTEFSKSPETLYQTSTI